jgi:hypothetical protein
MSWASGGSPAADTINSSRSFLGGRFSSTPNHSIITRFAIFLSPCGNRFTDDMTNQCGRVPAPCRRVSLRRASPLQPRGRLPVGNGCTKSSTTLKLDLPVRDELLQRPCHCPPRVFDALVDLAPPFQGLSRSDAGDLVGCRAGVPRGGRELLLEEGSPAQPPARVAERYLQGAAIMLRDDDAVVTEVAMPGFTHILTLDVDFDVTIFQRVPDKLLLALAAGGVLLIKCSIRATSQGRCP